MFAITALFLVAVFLAAELYRFKRRIAGLVKEIRFMDGDATGILGAYVQVATQENGEVVGFISGCQLCACPIAIGESVLLIPGPEGYIIKSPWLDRRLRRSCRKGAAI
jgi:hypothetical protein